MKSIQKNSIRESLDTIIVMNRASRKNLGEDSFYCSKSACSALVSVCDGCGGLGARKYQTFKGHTGAYVASRLVSGAIHDWYHDNWNKDWKNAKQFADDLDRYIKKAFRLCEPYSVEKVKIRGTMIRKFPTTLALAYAEHEKDGILLHVLWAGDSRIYLLDEQGIAQLTIDDTNVVDALENLICDGAMTNVLSADGNYKINYETIKITKPAIIFAATDGCFGYLQSPMEFEYIVLQSLVKTKTPEMFKQELYKQFCSYAGDDFAFGMMSFFYGNYENTRKTLEQRLDYLEKRYIHVMDGEANNDCIKKLWQSYKPVYERYLV